MNLCPGSVVPLAMFLKTSLNVWAENKGRHPQQKCIFFNIRLGLVSKHESEDRNSRSRLEAYDWMEEILDLVSKHETEGKKFSISSRSMRLKGRNSRSRLEG